MIDPEAAEDILDEEGEDPPPDEYGPSIPQDPSMLHADGDLHDLTDSDQVIDLVEQLKSIRAKLKLDELNKYEGKSTEWGGGGRSRLLYDQVRANLAQEWHEGRTSMSWENQHQEAMKVVRVVAIKNRARF